MKIILLSDKGSALTYMTIIVLLSSLFFGGFLKFVNPVIFGSPALNKDKIALYSEARLSEMQNAFAHYVEREGRLPCPADPDSKAGDPGFGKSVPCSSLTESAGRDGLVVRTGVLPVYSMNLKGDFLYDHKGKKIIYAVTEQLTEEASYSNDGGAISILNNDGSLRTDKALYTIVSTATGSLSDCDTSKKDGENCDLDAEFVDGEHALNMNSASFYDDQLLYSMQEPSTASAKCGFKGMLYAPNNAGADNDDCLNVSSYRSHQAIQFDDEYNVECMQTGTFCEGSWIDLAILDKGDYLIDWNASFRYENPRQGQYAVLEFRLGDEDQRSEKIVVNGNQCDVQTTPQNENGLVSLATNTTAKLQVRQLFYGGGGPSCPGNSRFAFYKQGEGILPAANKSAYFNILKRDGGKDYTGVSQNAQNYDEENPKNGNNNNKEPGGGQNNNGGTDPSEVISNPEVTIEDDTFVTASMQQIEGRVTVRRNGQEDFLAGEGDVLQGGDRIIVGEGGGASLKFPDQTTFYISGGTEFDLNEYYYQPSTGDGKLDVTLVRGMFYFLSGLIKKDPYGTSDPNYDIKTPSASLGIRGTEVFAVHLDKDERFFHKKGSVYDFPKGSYFFLLNGEPNFPSSNRGEIEVTGIPNSDQANTKKSLEYISAIETGPGSISVNTQGVGYSQADTWMYLLKATLDKGSIDYLEDKFDQECTVQSYGKCCYAHLTHFAGTSKLENIIPLNTGCNIKHDGSGWID